MSRLPQHKIDFHEYYMDVVRHRQRQNALRKLAGLHLGTRGAHQLLMGGGGGASDPLFTSVKALLHYNGSNGSSTFTDQKGHTFAADSGSPTLSTSGPKYGTASLRMGVATNSVSSSSFESDFGYTSEYCVEFWYNPDTVGVTRSMICWFQNGASAERYAYCNSSNQIVTNSSWGSITATSATISAATWQHIAFDKEAHSPNPNYRVWISGVLAGSALNSTIGSANSATARKFQFGSNGSTAGNGHVGNWDDFRFTIASRYNATFTPSATEWPDS